MLTVMAIDRYTQKAQVKAVERCRMLAELQQLAADIDRCQSTITVVMTELGKVNIQYAGERTTRQEVEYLTVLLDCAKRKLAWEKQIASLQKRAPALLQAMGSVMNDQTHPPSEELKGAMLASLQAVQTALGKLQPPTV